MRYFDDIVCELHALEWHGLPLHACAGTINKSLKSTGQETIKCQLVKSRANTDRSSVLQSTHPILVDDIYNGHQLASMGSERDKGNTADLNEAFEHLRRQNCKLHRKWLKSKSWLPCTSITIYSTVLDY